MTFRRKKLIDLLADRAEIHDPEDAVLSGRVLVDGVVVTNPRSLVRADASIRVAETRRLRGELKLGAALEAFGVDPSGRVALDAGAAAGGFTRALLEAGAEKVYAVDAGHGQLIGSLRQDPRVVNLEGTNLGELDRRLVPDTVEVVTLDLTYLSLAEAAAQLAALHVADGADLLGLVKPAFELRLPVAPTDTESVRGAVISASRGLEQAGWRVIDSIQSPLFGAGGAAEGFVHARFASTAEREVPG
ncbi:MAG: SAM-dependent methyltransferase [Actinomycetota bacterium]